MLLTSMLLPSPALAVIFSDPFQDTREASDTRFIENGTVANGAFTYTAPITVSPGRNGMQPKLDLSYSSRDERHDSLFGYGWSLNIPYIERLNKIGSDKLYNQVKANTFFSSSLSGELLPLGSTTPANSLLSTSALSAVFQKPFPYRHLSFLEDIPFPAEEKIETADDSAINMGNGETGIRNGETETGISPID